MSASDVRAGGADIDVLSENKKPAEAGWGDEAGEQALVALEHDVRRRARDGDVRGVERADDGAERDEGAADAAQDQTQAPGGAVEEESAAPAAQAPTFKVGDIARVKAGSKSAGGKSLKTTGKVGRVVGVGDDGRVHLRHGERSHEFVVVEHEQLEHYKADPLIGSKVRVVSAGLLEKRSKLLWRKGVVTGIREDGWRITFDVKPGEDELVESFGTEELEVLA